MNWKKEDKTWHDRERMRKRVRLTSLNPVGESVESPMITCLSFHNSFEIKHIQKWNWMGQRIPNDNVADDDENSFPPPPFVPVTQFVRLQMRNFERFSLASTHLRLIDSATQWIIKSDNSWSHDAFTKGISHQKKKSNQLKFDDRTIPDEDIQ